MKPQTYPSVFFRLTILLIIGILLAGNIQFQPSLVQLIVLFLGCFFIVLSTRRIWNIQKRILNGVLISISTILLGFTCAKVKQYKTNIPKSFQECKKPYVVEIQSSGKETDKTFRYVGKVVIHQDSSLVNEQLVVYASKEIKQIFTPKQMLLVEGVIQRIPSPENPNTFNYQNFMDKKDIHFHCFLNKNNLLNVHNAQSIKPTFIERIRVHCHSFISDFVSDKQQPIAQALLIGDKSNLEENTQVSFQRSGTTHILAVSGLHVGIIYIILLFSLKQISRVVSIPNWLVTTIFIIGIWMFVLVTGAKPSTIRAGFMFTLFVIGKSIRPTIHSINILAAVAFFMLCINPFYLTDVGFQLSFSAVAGIILFNPSLRLFLTKYRILNYFISITLISIVAQLSTLPLVIYYFHNTPLLGVFANLIAIPAAFIIVGSGFLGILTAKLPFLPILFGQIMSFSISILSETNQWISQFDFAALHHNQIQPIQVFLLLFCVFTFFIHLYNRSMWLFYSVCFSMCLFLGMEGVALMKANRQEAIYVYSLSNNLVIDIHYGRSSHLLYQYPIHANDKSFTIHANHKANRIKTVKQSCLLEKQIYGNCFFYKNGILQLKNMQIQLLTDSTKTIYKNVDYLIGYPLKSATKIQRITNMIQAPLIIHQYMYKEDHENVHNLVYDGGYVITR